MSDLVRDLIPERTVLFLGAGASAPSGLPCGRDLGAVLWADLEPGTSFSGSFTEVCSALEGRHGRRELVAAVRRALTEAMPRGIFLELPRFQWNSIYSTNFDLLVEEAYRRAGVPLARVTSNYDYDQTARGHGIPFFKIHGSLEYDRSDGNAASLVLTQQDVASVRDFRQLLFGRLQLAFAANDALVIGSSLSDPDLIATLEEALRVQREGGPGQVRILLYERDDIRAEIYERQGVRVTFGGIEEFLDALAAKGSAMAPTQASTAPGAIDFPRWQANAIDEESRLPPNVVELYHGQAARYPDVAAGVTFARSAEQRLLDALAGESRFATLLGPAGVGKTSLARRLAANLVERGWAGWEAKRTVALDPDEWLRVDSHLIEASRDGVLVVDEATGTLGEVNRLARTLSAREGSRLRLILTAETAHWIPRLKTRELFSKGIVHSIEGLDDGELRSLLAQLAIPDIARLIPAEFRRLQYGEQFRRLRERCGADMFVCLKNVFATDELDTILLRELNGLTDRHREVYRTVALLEAALGTPHRQMVLRLYAMDHGQLQTLLDELQGLVVETEISPSEGVYSWTTRHPVIARTIARYESTGAAHLEFMQQVVANMNPSIRLELVAVREICNSEFGINAVPRAEDRAHLYRALIDVAPGERIPRHRLVRAMLDAEAFGEAETALREAVETVGEDRPLARYAVRLQRDRSIKTAGLTEAQVRVMLDGARERAEANIRRFSDDKYSYREFAEVGLQIARHGGGTETLDQSIEAMDKVAGEILDPELAHFMQMFRRFRREFP